MDELNFVWDTNKANINFKKHKITFEEAKTVFFDVNAIEFFDPDHSQEEDRFLFLGMSRNLKAIIISYCYREKEAVIRIISARKATKNETKIYFKGIKL
jgi:uncharacterized DUF497 family protein